MKVLSDSSYFPKFSLPIKGHSEPLELGKELLTTRAEFEAFSKAEPEFAEVREFLDGHYEAAFEEFATQYPGYQRGGDQDQEAYEFLSSKLEHFFVQGIGDLNDGKLKDDAALEDFLEKFTLSTYLFSQKLEDKFSRQEISKDLRALSYSLFRNLYLEVLGSESLSLGKDKNFSQLRFERLTGKVMHFDLATNPTIPTDRRVEMYSNVKHYEIDWNDEDLKVLSGIFDLTSEELTSIVKHFGVIFEPSLKLEGYATNNTGTIYMNLDPSVLDTLGPSTKVDPSPEQVPASTLVHELSHQILKNKFPFLFLVKDGDPKFAAKQISLNLFGETKNYPVQTAEELICFALNMYVNPIRTALTLSASQNAPSNYAAAVGLARQIRSHYNLSASSKEDNSDPEMIRELKESCISVVKDIVSQLKQMQTS